jgi:hypothetical protein
MCTATNLFLSLKAIANDVTPSVLVLPTDLGSSEEAQPGCTVPMPRPESACGRHPPLVVDVVIVIVCAFFVSETREVRVYGAVGRGDREEGPLARALEYGRLFSTFF